MAMYVPFCFLQSLRNMQVPDQMPRLISLDEAFAGVDETNIRDMFRLMVEFGFNFL